MKLLFKQIFSTVDDAFEQALDIYFHAFPSNERQPLEKIKERIHRGQSQLFVAMQDDKVVGMALLFNFQNSSYVLLDYLAIAEAFRGQQVGSKLFQFLVAHLTGCQKYMIIEVEDPQFGENADQRMKRIQFYLHNGAWLMDQVPYILPSLDNTEPTAMRLMMAPRFVAAQMSSSELKQLIQSMYVEVYNKNEQDKLLLEILHQIPENIHFSNTLQS